MTFRPVARGSVLPLLCLALWIPGPRTLDSGPRTQQWRADGLASFDEAWQTVADTFYDPSFGGVDWPSVRAELRPRAESATSADEIRKVIAEMLGRLRRSHVLLLSASDAVDAGPMGEAAVPIDVRVGREGLVITWVQVQSPPAGAGLAAGQRLLAIDGTDTAGWRLTSSDAADRRRAMTLWRRAQRALHGDAGSNAALVVASVEGVERRLSVARVLAPGQVVAFGNLPRLTVRTDVRELRSPAGRRAGFIGFNFWMTAIDPAFSEAVDRFRTADAVIVDLRGNPGGLAAMISGIAGHFIDDPNVLLGRMQTRQGQLEFHPNPRTSTADGRRVRPYGGRLAILVDELTGSTSECFAGALQALGRARVFGRQTSGEALPALTKRLANGDVLMYAVGNFITASGRSLEGEGVIPDEIVPLSAEAMARGPDPFVEAVLAWLDR